MNRQYCWESGGWKTDPQALGRDPDSTKQILSTDACPWLLYTCTKGWQESQREAIKTFFPLVYGTFYFQNGLRSGRNTTRHAESLNVKGLWCVLWALELLICMKVHGTISPCNTLQCWKNQCPRAQKDEYRAFQLSFFPLKMFLPSNRFKRQYDIVFIFVKKMLSLCKDLTSQSHWVMAHWAEDCIDPENTVG